MAMVVVDNSGPEKLAEYENVVTSNYQKFVLNTGYKGFEPLPPPAVPVQASAVNQGNQKPAPKPKKKRSSPNKRIKTLEEI